MTKVFRRSLGALFVSLSTVLSWPGPPTEAGPLPDLACRSLAALYARVPEQFDPQDIAALQGCIGAALAQLAPVPLRPPAPAQRVDRFKGDWPESAPWTTPPDRFPYPMMW
ncbi:MAG TPA: hypothetical protein VMD08_00315 [Candidatus Baltobacteraceae bacterium]|nr:hypothetical protein [Candidatus Baltobacteraceae bacterium]